jgi:hypothetical protein
MENKQLLKLSWTEVDLVLLALNTWLAILNRDNDQMRKLAERINEAKNLSNHKNGIDFEITSDDSYNLYDALRFLNVQINMAVVDSHMGDETRINNKKLSEYASNMPTITNIWERIEILWERFGGTKEQLIDQGAPTKPVKIEQPKDLYERELKKSTGKRKLHILDISMARIIFCAVLFNQGLKRLGDSAEEQVTVAMQCRGMLTNSTESILRIVQTKTLEDILRGVVDLGLNVDLANGHIQDGYIPDSKVVFSELIKDMPAIRETRKYLEKVIKDEVNS